MIFLRKSAKGWDKVIVLLSIPISIALFVISGLDVIRYQWSQTPSVLKAIGFAAIIASFALIFLVTRENTFLSGIVEIQKERGHKIITTGPYQYVRHPMYGGVIVWLFCIPLALGSLYAFIPSLLMVLLFILRTFLEDKTLLRELPGYEEYTQKVRYRLIPGVW